MQDNEICCVEDADLGLVGGPTMTFWPAPAAPPHEVAAAGVAPGPGVGGVGDNAALPKAGALAPVLGRDQLVPHLRRKLAAASGADATGYSCQVATQVLPRYGFDFTQTSKHEELGKQAKANLLLASSIICLLFFVVCKWNKPATNCYESMVHQKI